VIYSEAIPIGKRLRDVHQHTDGRIVLFTDRNELIFLSPTERPREEMFVANYIASAHLTARMRDRLSEAVETCGQCHSFASGDNANAPSLARIYGRDIASTSFAGYSPALQGKSGRWTRERLRAFLTDPQSFAPGAAMPNPGIRDPKVIDELISLLEARRESF
jgi:cytochrome c2